MAKMDRAQPARVPALETELLGETVEKRASELVAPTGVAGTVAEFDITSALAKPTPKRWRMKPLLLG